MKSRPIVRVKDVMKSDFDMVDGLTTVSDALKNAEHLDTKCLIVDKRHEDDEFGMVMLSDIAKQVLANDKAPERVNIYEIMCKPVVAVDPEMDIRYCARLFENLGLSRAPVVDERKVVGVIGYSDIVLLGLVKHL